jgi:hypothetical protein
MKHFLLISAWRFSEAFACMQCFQTMEIESVLYDNQKLEAFALNPLFDSNVHLA